jgi:uncharacterized membrane protein
MSEQKVVQTGLASGQLRAWLFLLFVLAVGSVLRLYMLGVKSLWLDESFSVLVAGTPLPLFLRTMWWGEANMALYYFFLRFWMYLGDSEFWMRSLSALFGIMTIPAVYALGSRFLSRKAGLFAAALLAVHSYHIRYSQELRAYTLVTLLVVLSTYAFLRALEAPDRKVFWVLYALFSALAIYAQVLSVFVLCSQWLVLTPGRIKRVGILRLLFSGAAIGILAAPMVAVMLLQNKGQLDWVPRPNLIRIYDVFQYMAGAEPLGSHYLARIVLLLLYVATWIFAFASIFRFRRDQSTENVTKVALQVLILGLIFPIAAMIGLSFVKPIMVPRYLLMCVPAAVLIASQGLIALDHSFPRLRAISLAIFLGMIATSLFSVRDYYGSFATYGHAWGKVTSFILSQQEPGDAAIFYAISGHRVFDYYVKREREAGSQDVSLAVIFPLEFDRAFIESRIAPYHRVWLVLHQTIPTEETGRKTELIRDSLQERFRLSSEKEFPGASATRDEIGTIVVALYDSATPKLDPLK